MRVNGSAQGRGREGGKSVRSEERSTYAEKHALNLCPKGTQSTKQIAVYGKWICVQQMPHYHNYCIFKIHLKMLLNELSKHVVSNGE